MSLFTSGPAYRPMVYTSDAQRADEATQRRLLGTDTSLFGAGAIKTATASIMYDAIGLTYPDDPNWSVDEKTIEELGAGLHPSYWPVLGQSKSRDHAEFLRRQLFDRQTADEILSTNGWAGTGAAFLTGAIDPAFLITTAGAGGLLRAGMLARTAAMGPTMSRAITEGAIATAGMAVPQVYLQATDPTVTTSETVIALGLAAGLGGLAGGIAGRLSPREARSLEDLARAGEADVMVESAGAMGAMGATETRDAARLAFAEQLTEKGRKYFSSLTAKKQNTVLDQIAAEGDDITKEMVDEFGKTEAGTAFFKAAEEFTPRAGPNVYEVIDPNAPKANVADEALGAASDGGNGPGTVQKTAFDFDFSWAGAADFARFAYARFSNAAFFGRRKSSLARVVGAASMDDALAKVGPGGERAVSGDNALSAVRRLSRARMGKFAGVLNENLDGHLKARGIKGTREDINWFNEQVGRAVAGLNVNDTFVQRAAQELRETFAELGESMKRAGVKGFEDFNPNDTYFTRIWSPARLNVIIADKGEDAVVSVLRNAIAVAQPGIAEETLNTLAKGLVKGVQRRGLVSADSAARAVLGGLDDIEATLKVGLGDGTGMVGAAEQNTIDAIMDSLRKAAADRQAAGIPMGRKRIKLDEFAVDPDTQLKVDDFLERDARVIANQYIRSATGALAEKEVLRVLALAIDPTGKTPVRSWQAAMEAVEKDLIASGEQSKIKAVLHRMDIMHRMIRGLPLQDADQMRTLAHYATTYNQAVYGGSFALANIPETLSSLAEIPIKNILGSVRSIGNIAELVRLRKQPRGLVGEIMSVTGRGSDHILSEITRRFDPIEGTLVEPNRFVRGVNSLIDFQAKYSGFAALNDASQRFTVLAPAIEMIDKASRGVAFGTATRTLAMGLDEATYKGIGRNAKHVQYKVVDGKKVVDSFNFEAWEPQIAAKFIVAVQRNSERMVQQVDFGQMAPWMTTWWGSIIRQLRTFTIAAWDKQLLHGIDTVDQKTLARFTVGATSGALLYIARQHVMSLGQDENKRDKFLEDQLTPERIAAAAWANGGYSSLTPDIIDWAKYVFVDRFDNEASPIFTARYSQLQSRGVLSNPTSSTALRAGMAFKGALGATTDKGEFTQRDANNLTRIMPLQNMMGIRQLLNYTVSQFPEDER